MTNDRKPPRLAALDDAGVADYLQRHPDFFERHPDLVAVLRVPHPSGGAISLIERQVELLRQHNRQLERKLVDLIEIARANDAAVERIHQLALVLMESEDLIDLLAALQDSLRNRFGAEAVAICLFRGDAGSLQGGPARRIAADDPALAQFANFLKGGKPQCGRLRPAQLEFLFDGAAADVGSAALIPLGEHAELGFVAVGARSEDHFSPALGTVYLGHIGALVACALRRFLS